MSNFEGCPEGGFLPFLVISPQGKTMGNNTGWWYTYPSEKYVSWDDEIPNIWKNKTCSKLPIILEFMLIIWGGGDSVVGRK